MAKETKKGYPAKKGRENNPLDEVLLEASPTNETQPSRKEVEGAIVEVDQNQKKTEAIIVGISDSQTRNVGLEEVKGIGTEIAQTKEEIEFEEERERILNITDPELRKTEEIKLVMGSLAKGVGEASANKIKEYTNRILAGKNKEYLLQGLSPSFVDGVERLLEIEENAAVKLETKEEITNKRMEALSEKELELNKLKKEEEGLVEEARVLQRIKQNNTKPFNAEKEAGHAIEKLNKFIDKNSDEIVLKKEVAKLKNLFDQVELFKKQKESLETELSKARKEGSLLVNIKKIEEEIIDSEKYLKSAYEKLEEQNEVVNAFNPNSEQNLKKLEQGEETLPINTAKEENITPEQAIEEKNEEVLQKFEQNYLNINDAPTESNIKGIANLQKEFFKNAKESLKNAYGKSMEWLTKDESELTSKERLTRKMLTAGMIGASIFGIGEISGLNNPAVNNANKVWIRSAAAGLMSSITTWGVTQKAIDKIKGDWKSASTWTKAGVVVTGVGVGAGLAVSFLGASTLAITGAAIATKLGSNKAFDKWASNVENQKKELDINALAKSLKEIEEEKAKIDKKLKQIRVYKNLTAGAISIASGLGSMVANQIEFKLRGDTQNININNKEIAKVEVNKEVNLGDNKVEESIKKPFLSKIWDQIKTSRSSEEATIAQDSTKVNINPLLNRDGTPIPPQELNKPEIVDTTSNPEEITGNKMDIKDIKSEAIIDGKERVGITYAFRDQLKADPKLIEAMKKTIDIDSSKLNDPSYIAKITKEIAIKTGYMDAEGHEVRISSAGMGKVAYELGVDAEGKLQVTETNLDTGKVEVHCEGDVFEGSNIEKEYEYNNNKSYNYNQENNTDKLLSPEKITNYSQPTYTMDYSRMDDDSSYLENNYNNQITKPGTIDDEIVAPEKILEVYKFENIQTSPDWENLKGNNLKDFFATGKINMSEEEVRVAESLRSFYKEALESSNNDEDFQDFVRNNPKLTIGEATALYKDVIEDGDFADDLKEKYHFYDWKDSLSRVEVKSETMKEMEKIAKDNFKGKFSQSELKSVNRFYEKNLSLIIKEDRDAWYEYKNQSASDYLKTYKDDHDDFTNFLKDLKKVTGLKPNNGFLGLGHKEQIDEYIMRATMKAKLDGRLDEIDLLKKTTIYEENQNEAENYEDYKPSKKIEVDQKENYDDKPYNKNTGKSIPNKEDELKNYKPSKNKGGDDLYREN